MKDKKGKKNLSKYVFLVNPLSKLLFFTNVMLEDEVPTYECTRISHHIVYHVAQP